MAAVTLGPEENHSQRQGRGGRQRRLPGGIFMWAGSVSLRKNSSHETNPTHFEKRWRRQNSAPVKVLHLPGEQRVTQPAQVPKKEGKKLKMLISAKKMLETLFGPLGES